MLDLLHRERQKVQRRPFGHFMGDEIRKGLKEALTTQPVWRWSYRWLSTGRPRSAARSLNGQKNKTLKTVAPVSKIWIILIRLTDCLPILIGNQYPPNEAGAPLANDVPASLACLRTHTHTHPSTWGICSGPGDLPSPGWDRNRSSLTSALPGAATGG